MRFRQLLLHVYDATVRGVSAICPETGLPEAAERFSVFVGFEEDNELFVTVDDYAEETDVRFDPRTYEKMCRQADRTTDKIQELANDITQRDGFEGFTMEDVKTIGCAALYPRRETVRTFLQDWKEAI